MVKVYDGTTYVGQATVDSSSNTWTLQLSNVSQGAHSYTTVITDVAGNAGAASAAFTLTVAADSSSNGCSSKSSCGSSSSSNCATRSNHDATTNCGSSSHDNTTSSCGSSSSSSCTTSSSHDATTSCGSSTSSCSSDSSSSDYHTITATNQSSHTYTGSGNTLDVVDYKSASSAITVDLSKTGSQSTGWGTATLKSIEGVFGGSGNDTFTDGSGNNLFNGRGGNDTYNLTHGGHDTIVYDLLSKTSATGGNGLDTVNGFTVANFSTSAQADRLDLLALLNGYKPDADGPVHFIKGVATIDAGDNIANYLSVSHKNGDTTISVDLDGSGHSFSATPLVTLHSVNVDLATLLANHQIVV